MTLEHLRIILLHTYNAFLWVVVVLVVLNFINYFLSLIILTYRYKALESEKIDKFTHSKSFPGITFFVPCKNESTNIVRHLKALLNLDYTNKQVIVVNDGSDDNTAAAIINGFGLKKLPPAIPQQVKTATVKNYFRSGQYPNLIFIDKEHGGKADALNAALNVCDTPYFVTVDADTIIEPEGFHRAMFSFLTRKNAVALGSTLSVLNGCKYSDEGVVDVAFPRKYLPGIQALEYMRAFFNFRAGAALFGGNMVVPGSFGIFDTAIVRDVGGYPTNSVTEDLGLTIKLHRKLKWRRRYAIDFVPTTVAWTIVPDNIRCLWAQRERWQRGTCKVMLKNWFMFLNPFYGRIGIIGFPHIIFETIWPLIEFTCYLMIPISLMLGLLNWDYMYRGILASFALTMLMSIMAMFVEELTFRRYPILKNLPRMFLCALLESLGPRQMVLLARIQAFGKFMINDMSWKSARSEKEEE